MAMTIADIEKIIAGEETRTLEVKESTGEIVKGMASACAFLNSDGGWLIFGVTPKMKIVGQNVSDSTRQEVSIHLRRLEPSLDAAAEYIPVPGRDGFYVIAIYFDPNVYTNAPYTYDGKAYYKVENTTVMMPRQMYEERLRLSNPNRFSWENRTNEDILATDLDTDLVFQVLHKGISERRILASALTLTDIVDVLSKFNLTTPNRKLRNAANVLFGKDPTKHHMHCKVRLARFEGRDKKVFRDQKVSEGNLFEQYDAILSFCLKHLFLGGRMDSKYRIDLPTVPHDVLKEATINMLAHRSWDDYAATPSVAIYDDRIEFQNPGNFPIGYTYKSFMEQIGSLPHNPLIASVLYRCKLMEHWGRGISLILDNCVGAGLPEPSFSVSQKFVTLTIYYSRLITPGFDRNEHKNEHNLVIDIEGDKSIFEHKMSTKTQNEHKNEHKTAKKSQNEHKNEHNLVLDTEGDKSIFEHKMSTKTQNEHKNERKTAKNPRNEHKNEHNLVPDNEGDKPFFEHKNEHKKNPREYAQIFDSEERARINQIIESLNYNTQKNINEILWMIQGNENISINRLVQELKLPKITVRRCLGLLQELKLIKRVGANRGGHWSIMVDLSSMGKVLREPRAPYIAKNTLDKLDKLST